MHIGGDAMEWKIWINDARRDIETHNQYEARSEFSIQLVGGLHRGVGLTTWWLLEE